MLNAQLPVPGQPGSKTPAATSGTVGTAVGRCRDSDHQASSIVTLVGLHHELTPAGNSAWERTGTGNDCPHAGWKGSGSGHFWRPSIKVTTKCRQAAAVAPEPAVSRA